MQNNHKKKVGDKELASLRYENLITVAVKFPIADFICNRRLAKIIFFIVNKANESQRLSDIIMDRKKLMNFELNSNLSKLKILYSIFCFETYDRSIRDVCLKFYNNSITFHQ